MVCVGSGEGRHGGGTGCMYVMTKTNERLDRLITYFESACPKDSIWVCWFLSGNRIKGAIKTGELRSFLSEKVNLPIWLIEECHDRVGDLAETISLLAGSSSMNKSISLDETIREFLLPVKGFFSCNLWIIYKTVSTLYVIVKRIKLSIAFGSI